MLPKNYTYKPLPEEVTISPSKIEGLGLHARRHIHKGKVLGITHVYDDRFDNGMIRTPLGGFINASLNPNCILTRQGDFKVLATLKDIRPGEELTVNYLLERNLS